MLMDNEESLEQKRLYLLSKIYDGFNSLRIRTTKFLSKGKNKFNM